MNYIKVIMAVGAIGLLSLASCNSKSMEQSEETAAEIEAAQLEGREAARVFVNRPWRDTIELQGRLLEARAAQSKYVRAKKPRCAEAYDSAFVSTLRTVNMSVADELEKAQRNQKTNRVEEAR